MKLLDPLNIGLIYVYNGSFVVKLKPLSEVHDPQSENEKHRELFISEGQYLDDERILKDYKMILVSIECTSGTGKVLNLSSELYKYLQQHSETLSKFHLHTLVLNLNPPMMSQTQKSINNFLNLFNLKIYKSGKVLSTEIGRAPLATILL